MKKISFKDIKFARAQRYYPISQVQFITSVALKLMAKVPEDEILNYPITTARPDYLEAVHKICEMFNTNNIIKVFGVSTFKGLNTLHKKCMSAKQK